jgi:hypothetical protein
LFPGWKFVEYFRKKADIFGPELSFAKSIPDLVAAVSAVVADDDPERFF